MVSDVSLQQVLKRLDNVESELKEMKQIIIPSVRLSKKEIAELKKAEQEIKKGEFVSLDEFKKELVL